MDNAVDKLHEAIKLYVTKHYPRKSRTTVRQAARWRSSHFAINLEHIGDIIDKNLMELAAKKIKNRLKFSDEGRPNCRHFHRRVIENLKLALSVFISGDVKIARQLIEEKVAIRQAERAGGRKSSRPAARGPDSPASRPVRCISIFFVI